MRTEVYSWRLSDELKSDLEREARLRRMPVSAILDLAVREWLKKSALDVEGEEAQRELHATAEQYLGVFAGRNRQKAETAREAVRKKLRRRYGR
jgi:predicted transcriptional regulator